MNTQEVIELLNLQEIQAKQEVIKKYQVDKATIIRVHTNDKYDLSNGMVNIQPLDTSKKFSVGDSVFLQIPTGDKQQTKIVARSNIKIPDEELYEYGEEPAQEGTIYLCCPGDEKIKVYSLDGTPGTDISPGSNAIYNICADETYLYCSSNLAYVAFRIKPDGSEYREIVLQSRYYKARGLAINSTSTYLYTAYSTWEPSRGIAKINISTGEVEETELTNEYGAGEIKDICNDSNHLYVLFLPYEDMPKILKYDFNCNYIGGITPNHYKAQNSEKITTDGTNFYLNDFSLVGIYNSSGNFINSIEVFNMEGVEEIIKCVAVKDSNIYIVTTSKIKKYNSSGVFQSEFEIEGTVEDAVVI